jgi:hypothetical protein
MLSHFGERIPDRDRRVAGIKSLLERRPDRSRVRCLVVDLFLFPEFSASVYEHLMLYSPVGRTREREEDFSALGCVRVASEKWPAIEEAANDLLAVAGPGRNGPPSTVMDAAVVSYFDGVNWHVGRWFYLTATSELYENSSPVVQAMVRMLYFIRQASADSTIGSMFAGELVDFGLMRGVR